MRQSSLDEFLFVCPWCGKVMRNRAGLSTHASSCKSMPELMKNERQRERLAKIERVKEIQAMIQEIQQELTSGTAETAEIERKNDRLNYIA